MTHHVGQVFTVAAPIPEDSPLAELMKEARRRLTAQKITFQEPNLGDLITILPRFYASEDAERWLALGLKLLRSYMVNVPDEHRLAVESRGFSFLGNGGRAFVVTLGANNGLIESINDMRASVTAHGDWVYPPDRQLTNLHATIAEAPGIQEQVEKGKNRGNSPFNLLKTFKVPMPIPYLLVEKGGAWSRVHF